MTIARGRRPIEWADTFRIEWPSQPALSPDGTRLAFVLSRLDEAADAIASRVAWQPVDAGGDPQPCGDVPGRNPRWLPDGRRVLFTSGGRIHLFDVEIRLLSAVPGLPKGATSPAVTPDGRSIVIVVPDQGTGRTHLWRMGLDGTGLTRLTDGDGDDDQPRVSPDGRTVAFRSTRDVDDPLSQRNGIWTVPIAGGEPRQVARPDGPVRVHAWSPDGRRIAWIGHRRGERQGLNFELWVTEVGGDGGAPAAPRQLAADLDRTIGLTVRADPPGPFLPSDLAWDPAGQGCYVTYPEHGTSRVAHIALTEDVTPLAVGPRAVHGFGVAASSGRVAVVFSPPDDPGQVSVLDPLEGGESERVVTDLNAAWRAEVAMGPLERFDLAAPDGHPLEAWLLHPASRPATQRLPLILHIHGGPHWPLGERFCYDMRRLAERGYRILFMNSRGSQGYGEAYALANRADWGGIDARDLLAAVDVAARRPDVDPDRVGVMGESYGGFMTLWLIGTTQRFRAAVAQSNISDFRSMVFTTDAPIAMADELGGMPWEQPTLYEERSPIGYVAQMTTPVLLVHSDEDTGCPIDQSEMLHTALKLLGRETELVRLPGEGHLINLVGRPTNRWARVEAMDRWFETYLGAVAPRTGGN
ncbi:MAG: S9 family peptidase [Chloroflexi bacterium]|nr:S9 family peptidase [Chloroflexota bacterium]